MKRVLNIITGGFVLLISIVMLIGFIPHHSITKGIISDKYTTEPHTVMIPIRAGKVTTFTPSHVPKKYHIVITGKTNSGKEVQEDFTVTSVDYDKYNKGDQFNYNDVSHDEQD